MIQQEACLVCGEELEYSESAFEMTCYGCRKTFLSNAHCRKGHFICDECHSKMALNSALNVCKSTMSKNPQEIMFELMRSPGVHMHGPEHHTLIGFALMTACYNAGSVVDLHSAMEKIRQRGEKVPGGICGFWGSCGAAVGAGIFLSVLTNSTPLSEESYGMCNAITAKCLERIAQIGGPRCCKRNTALSIEAAAEFLSENLSIELDRSEKNLCTYFSQNAQCIKKRCPFWPGATRDHLTIEEKAN